MRTERFARRAILDSKGPRIGSCQELVDHPSPDGGLDPGPGKRAPAVTSADCENGSQDPVEQAPSACGSLVRLALRSAIGGEMG